MTVQLDYKQKYNGQYILSKIDIEKIATDVLKEFSPSNLVMPTQLDTMSFLQDYLGLNVKRKYIGTFESGILGSIVMCDEMEIPSYDEMFRPTVLLETYGNVLISPNLSCRENAPRRRYTEMHEGSHFILHKDYYKCLEMESVNQHKLIACRRMELLNDNPKTAADWVEWQADYMAAALLMPRDVFHDYARSIIRSFGVSRGYLTVSSSTNKRQAFEIISKIAERFYVSYRAAQIRMIKLGLIRENPYY